MPKEMLQRLPDMYQDVITRLGQEASISLFRHDLSGSADMMTIIWEDINVDCTQYDHIMGMDTPTFLQMSDKRLMESVPKIPVDIKNHNIQGKPKEYIQRGIDFTPYCGQELLVLRDSVGYLYNRVYGRDAQAFLYLNKLRNKCLPVKPMADLFKAKFCVGESVAEEPELAVNGIEYVILKNLIGNAFTHNTGEKIIKDGHDFYSVVEFNPDIRDFTVTSTALKEIEEEYDLDIQILALDFVRFGLFISGIYAFHLGKKLRVLLAPPKSFVCRVENLQEE